MAVEESRRRSRWMLRVLEWDDPRARYPNLWTEGMPRHVYAVDAVAHRLRLGDLISIYHPASKRHPARANRFLGISRVAGLREAEQPGFSWIDLTTAHRFATPLELDAWPRRVFLCCDAGWPEPDVKLFQRVWDAAVAEGWDPGPEIPRPAPEAEHEEARAEERPAVAVPAVAPGPPGPEHPIETAAPAVGHGPARGRVFGGVDYSGDMRDPREGTWLALVALDRNRLRVARLEATGRHGLHAHLRNPDALLMRAEAIGLDFPFGLPLPFAEMLLSGPFPEEGWWALARRLEKLTRPEYLVALQEFREAHGEPRRLTDERAHGFSPLHRVNPDLGPMTYHGIRMIAEERSRYAIKPFETAHGRLLLEVYPGGFIRSLKLGGDGDAPGRESAIVGALGRLGSLPVTIEEPHLKICRTKRDALDAVIAARLTAAAVLSGEAEQTAEALAPSQGERVRLEGWIYGLLPEGEALG
jgi:hypothetical protein